MGHPSGYGWRRLSIHGGGRAYAPRRPTPPEDGKPPARTREGPTGAPSQPGHFRGLAATEVLRPGRSHREHRILFMDIHSRRDDKDCHRRAIRARLPSAHGEEPPEILARPTHAPPGIPLQIREQDRPASPPPSPCSSSPPWLSPGPRPR